MKSKRRTWTCTNEPKWSCIGKAGAGWWWWWGSHALKRKWAWMLLDRPRSSVTGQGAAVRMWVEELASLSDISEKEAETASFSSSAPLLLLLHHHPTHSALSTATPDVKYSFLLPLHWSLTLFTLSLMLYRYIHNLLFPSLLFLVLILFRTLRFILSCGLS